MKDPVVPSAARNLGVIASEIPRFARDDILTPHGGQRAFSPNSMLWRICREHAILLHGPAAAVMQVGHPRIGLGVFQHSDFQSSPIARLNRTLDTVYTIVFGTRDQALAAADRVRLIHQRIRGDAASHAVPGDTQYSAFEPDLLMWVIATMIMSSIDGYERAVVALSASEKNVFYRDMRVLGTFFDLPAEYGPQDWESFQSYWAAQLANPLLGSHDISRQVAWAVARPQSPWWLWLSSFPLMFLYSEILPEPVRGRLGFRSTWLLRASLRLATIALRSFVRIAPVRMRFVPHYLKASRDNSTLAPLLTVLLQSCRRGHAPAGKD